MVTFEKHSSCVELCSCISCIGFLKRSFGLFDYLNCRPAHYFKNIFTALPHLQTALKVELINALSKPSGSIDKNSNFTSQNTELLVCRCLVFEFVSVMLHPASSVDCVGMWHDGVSVSGGPSAAPSVVCVSAAGNTCTYRQHSAGV